MIMNIQNEIIEDIPVVRNLELEMWHVMNDALSIEVSDAVKMSAMTHVGFLIHLQLKDNIFNIVWGALYEAVLNTRGCLSKYEY